LGLRLTRVGAQWARHEFVSNSWRGYEESGDLRVRLNLAPEPGNKHVDAAIEGIRAMTCNSVPQLVT
jgi:hypothetical protein